MIRTQNSRRWAYAAASVSALTALAAVIALASRAPLSSSTPVDAASASAPITALVFVLIAVGAVMAGALIVLMWSGRRRKDDEPEWEAELPQVPWYWKLFALLILLVLVAALVAAALLGSRRPAVPMPILGPGLPGTRLAPPPSSGSNGFVVPSWLPWTALAVAVVAIAGGVAFLVFRNKPTLDDSVDSVAARTAVQAAIDALDTGRDARAAVIAAYAAMERTLAERGAPRSPAEAPREFLRRVLLAGHATEREAGTLTGLFEEARYSTHPIPERARGIASSALGSLRARLQVNESG